MLLLKQLKNAFFTSYEKETEELGVSRTFLEYVFNEVFEEVLTAETFTRNKRIDNRDFDTVRTIKTEVGLLPFNHGSALFQRGRTQALVSVTLVVARMSSVLKISWVNLQRVRLCFIIIFLPFR